MEMRKIDERLARRVERLTGSRVLSSARLRRGYTPAERWRLGLADGTSVFAKAGATPLTAGFLRTEARHYAELAADFMPRFVGFDDDPERPLLVLEDLSTARWPPPWEPGDIERLIETLARVARTRPLPPELPPLAVSVAARPGEPFSETGWAEVARDPGPFLGLGLCSEAWLRAALPRLVEAQAAAPLAGDDLLHCDVRSDNLCVHEGRLLLIDWNLAARGDGRFDLAFAAPSIRLEGGPLPEELIGRDAPFAALVSGFFAARAGLPVIPTAPRVRWLQTRQLRIALAWTARACHLPAPDLPWGQRAVDRLDELHREGKLEDPAWHEQVEEIIGDAYLATDDPRAGSGKSGGEDDWRWARELVLDALPPGARTLLDVGCANGYLLESFERWAAERSLAIDLYGVDISFRLAAVARRRLPHLAERIWVGNAADWIPPRRFDVVHTGLDYVPAPRRRAYVERLLRDVVAPAGRLVLRPERGDLVTELEALGVPVGGVLERAHPRTGELRRTAWIARADHQLTDGP
jgi:hypothetical protein